MGTLFTDKVVVITGGSKGLGLGAANIFIEEGAHVFIFGRGQKDLDAVKQSLGDRLYTVQGDISKTADLDHLYNEVEKHFEHIDVVMANAGINIVNKAQDVTEEDYDKLFDINTKGAFFTAQKALRLLKPGSSVIFTSSIAAHHAETGNCVYSGTKRALTGFAKTFSAEHAKDQIRFNIISPTIIRTPLTDNHFTTEQLKFWADKHPTKRLGKISDFVGVVKFLASPDSTFVYGQDIVVDGGLCDYVELIETIS